jgi:OmpA-OmpF porin, OOP family
MVATVATFVFVKENPMTPNLLKSVESYLTPDVNSKISVLLGETPSNTRRALDVVVPSLTAAACHQASTPSGVSGLMNLVSSSNLSSVTGNFADSLGGGAATDGLLKTGSSLISGLLGNRMEGVADLVADTAGIRPASASSLMRLVAPLLFGGLLKNVTGSGLTASGLPEFLSGHRDEVLRSIPGGLASRLGVGSNSDLCGAPAPVARPVVVQEPKRSWAGLWLLPLAALALGFFAWRVFHRPILASIRLPCGTTLSVEQGSFTFNLANFLLRGSASDLPKRFVFDHLNFDSATTQLTGDSNATVDNLVKIMACYPNLAVELDGHTDSTGDPVSNKTLSMDRANAVKDILVRDGIDAGRITTGGFGEERPIASNDTDEGRAKNRRTELVVTKM